MNGLSFVIVELKGIVIFFHKDMPRLLVLFREMREKVLVSYSWMFMEMSNVVISCISVVENMTLV
jgi:hypothetical protein